MNLFVKFNHNESEHYPCACLIYKNKADIAAIACGLGKTWDEAEAEAIAKARAQLNAGPPPEPKEISI